MSTRSFSTPIDHTSDAGFRTWATELFDEIVAAGLVQTSDTGQLASPVVAARPAANAVAGYWIFRFNDPSQATAPIFIKMEPGSAAGAGIPGLYVTVGMGSDGAGNITGVVRARAIIGVSQAPLSTVTPYPTRINYTDGFFCLVYKTGMQPQGAWFLAICRTCDEDGDPTPEGYFIVWKDNTTSNSGAAVSGVWGGYSASDTGRNWCLIPFVISASAAGGNYQAFKVMGVFPDTRIIQQLVVVVAAELSEGSTTGPVEVVDGVTHTYLSAGPAGRSCTVSSVATAYNFAIMW